MERTPCSGPSPDSGNQDERDIGAPTNLAARLQAEEQLRISEERHRLLAENANDVIWTMSLDGRITYVSPAVERMRGFTPEEAMSQPLDEIQTPESAAITLGYFVDLQAALEAGRPPQRFRGELRVLLQGRLHRLDGGPGRPAYRSDGESSRSSA